MTSDHVIDSWRSLFGVRLAGERLVRFVYIDEAGISNKNDEPWIVEAGVIVNPDIHLKAIETRFESIRADLLPDLNVREPFHAKDIWHGSGPFSRDKYDSDTRWRVLERMAAIPKELSLPIAAGWFQRAMLDEWVPAKLTNTLEPLRTLTFGFCVLSAESWLRIHAPDEVVMLIHEDTEQERWLRNQLTTFQNPEIVRQVGAPADLFPIVHIKDEIMFASKRGSRILQLADLCAFLIKRNLSQKSNSRPLFSLIAPQIVPHWTERRAHELLSQKPAQT